jgi:hypothetical protein
MLSQRERIIREALRREKRERWRLLEIAVRTNSVNHWWFWLEHMPIKRHDMVYMFGHDSRHLRRHIRIELWCLGNGRLFGI